MLWHRALAIRKDTLGERHLDYADSLSNLGGIYAVSESGRAERMLLQALEIRGGST